MLERQQSTLTAIPVCANLAQHTEDCTPVWLLHTGFDTQILGDLFEQKLEEVSLYVSVTSEQGALMVIIKEGRGQVVGA